MCLRFLFSNLCEHLGICFCTPCHPPGPAWSHFWSIVVPLVTLLMICEANWYLSELILKGIQELLAPLLALNFGIRQERYTPDTMQEHLLQTCKKLLKKRTGKKLAENLKRTSKKLAINAKNPQRTSKKPAEQNLKITNGILNSSTQQQPQRGPSFIIRVRRCARR